jgi:hypothetical protein
MEEKVKNNAAMLNRSWFRSSQSGSGLFLPIRWNEASGLKIFFVSFMYKVTQSGQSCFHEAKHRDKEI